METLMLKGKPVRDAVFAELKAKVAVPRARRGWRWCWWATIRPRRSTSATRKRVARRWVSTT